MMVLIKFYNSFLGCVYFANYLVKYVEMLMI